MIASSNLSSFQRLMSSDKSAMNPSPMDTSVHDNTISRYLDVDKLDADKLDADKLDAENPDEEYDPEDMDAVYDPGDSCAGLSLNYVSPSHEDTSKTREWLLSLQECVDLHKPLQGNNTEQSLQKNSNSSSRFVPSVHLEPFATEVQMKASMEVIDGVIEMMRLKNILKSFETVG